MDKVILVTGSNGFVGRNLVNKLIVQGEFRIVACDLQENSLPLQTHSQGLFSYFNGDCSSPQFISDLSGKYTFDSIIHLAGFLPQSENPSKYELILQSNVQSTFQLLELARLQNSKFIFPSTAMVYGSKNPSPFTEQMPVCPENFYALSKRMSEELIEYYHNKFNLNYTIFRTGVLYGPGQTGAMFIPSIISNLLEGRVFEMTGGEQKRDFIFIEDYIDLISIPLKSSVNGLFNAATGNAQPMKTVAQTVGTITNALDNIKLGALPYRENELWNYCLDIDKTVSAFNWQPRWNLHEGLKKTVEYHKKVLSAGTKSEISFRQKDII